MGTVLEGRPLRGQEEEVRGFPAGRHQLLGWQVRVSPRVRGSGSSRELRKPTGPGTRCVTNAVKHGP